MGNRTITRYKCIIIIKVYFIKLINIFYLYFVTAVQRFSITAVHYNLLLPPALNCSAQPCTAQHCTLMHWYVLHFDAVLSAMHCIVTCHMSPVFFWVILMPKLFANFCAYQWVDLSHWTHKTGKSLINLCTDSKHHQWYLKNQTFSHSKCKYLNTGSLNLCWYFCLRCCVVQCFNT